MYVNISDSYSDRIRSPLSWSFDSIRVTARKLRRATSPHFLRAWKSSWTRKYICNINCVVRKCSKGYGTSDGVFDCDTIPLASGIEALWGPNIEISPMAKRCNPDRVCVSWEMFVAYTPPSAIERHDLYASRTDLEIHPQNIS